MIHFALAIIFLLFSVKDVISKEYIGTIIWGIVAILNIIASIDYYKKI